MAKQAARIEAPTQAPTITRAIRVEIAKPLDCTWNEAGPLLRSLRTVSHRLLNAGIVELLVAERTGDKGRALVGIQRELEALREWATKKGVSHLATLEIPSSITDAMQMRARQAVLRWQKERRESRVPSFAKGAPIFIRDGGWSLVLDGESIALHLRLTAGRTGKTRFAVVASHGYHWDTLRKMADGEAKLGDCKIVYDENAVRKNGGHGKWFAILAITEPAPERSKKLDPHNVMVVHRGAHDLLYYATSTGFAGTIMSGSKLMNQKARLQARKRSIQATKWERGSGARGRGKSVAFAAYSALEDTEARVVKTACQQAAAAAVRMATMRGCGTIYREDYGGIQPNEDREIRKRVPRVPLHQLGESMDWAFRKAGATVQKVEHSYISSTCLRCGHVDPASHNRRTGIFHCTKCADARKADYVAAVHMLSRTGGDMTVWERKFEALRRVEDLATRGGESVRCKDVEGNSTLEVTKKKVRGKQR